jgi:hypothetical protein
MTHILAAAALVVHLSNFSGAPITVVRTAQEEVTRVYANIGVSVEWHEPSEPQPGPRPAIRIVLLPLETGSLRASEKTVMGSAVRTPGGNAIAYVYYRRVQDEAVRYQVSPELVLACTIAHELGHLLMPISGGHSPDGLMRACWSRDEFHRAELGQLHFRPAEADRIRDGLR